MSVNVEHNEVMYKTAMCRTFASSGSCPYGYKCLFAHGPEELRSVIDNEALKSSGASPRNVPNYRTTMNRSASAMHSLPMTRGWFLGAQQAQRSAVGQRHHSVINQSLVAQSARRSRTFFPTENSASMNLMPVATAANQRASTVYTPTQRRSQFGSLGASPLTKASPSPRQSLVPTTPLLSVTASSPRKWSATTPLSVEASLQLQETASPSSSARTPQSVERAKKLYKTELCRSWQEYQMCPYGLKCQFAHGESELRPVERHRKYKTEQCRKFHSEGVCPFGSRCIFIHDEDERELPNSPSYDAVFAAQMRQRRASGGAQRHLFPSMANIDPMSPLGMSPAMTASQPVNGASPVSRRSMVGMQPHLSPSSPMRSASPYSKRFSRFGDENTSVDDFIKRRMTDTSMDDRVNSLGNAMAGMALKDGAAKKGFTADASAANSPAPQKNSVVNKSSEDTTTQQVTAATA